MCLEVCFCFQDLLRTLPNNACFCSAKSTGIARLRRILRGIAWLYPDIGYCQGMGVVSIISTMFCTNACDIHISAWLYVSYLLATENLDNLFVRKTQPVYLRRRLI